MRTTTGPRKRRISRLRETGRRALLLAASTVVCVTSLEVAVRFLEPKEVMRYFYTQDDDVLHHQFKPNTVGRYQTTEFDTDYKINSLGLRDKEYSLQKPIDTFRILMLGDSFTEGDGVLSSETFSKRLEERLRDWPGRVKLEVINAGVGSYSPLLEYLYLKTRGLRLQPDLVVLNFDLSDVYDDINYTSMARFDEDGLPVGVSASREEHGLLTGSAAAIKDWFKDNTRLYNFIRIRLTPRLEAMKRPQSSTGDIRVDKYAMLRDTYVDSDANWTLTHKYLLLTRSLLQQRGIDFWMTAYPYGQQVHPQEWGSGRKYWMFKEGTTYSTWPQEKLERWGTANGIKVVNMCADFKLASKTTFPLYLDDNGHWAAAGHQLVADILFRSLRPYLEAKLAPAAGPTSSR